MTAVRPTPAIGYMPMPVNFKYRSVFLKGKPRHQKYDDFWRKHPPMGAARWAKIFAPFDALDGFDEAVYAKEEIYEARRELSEDEKEELNRKLQALRLLTYNGRAARANKPPVTITWFSPCTDVHNEWYGTGGQYVTHTGTVMRIDPISRCIVVDDLTIPLENIASIHTITEPEN